MSERRNQYLLGYRRMFTNDIRNTVLVIPTAIITGLVVGFFLWLLNAATSFRLANPWMLFLLPVAGIIIHFIYKTFGKSSERGNNLIIDEIHEPKAGIPILMAPVILFATVFTHLFGGSAGREGTAVQIGGGVAGYFSRLFKLKPNECRMLLISGVSAGFGAVFGTPLTGAVFGIEVLTIGKLKFDTLLPALVASIVANLTVSVLGVHHTQYQITEIVQGTYFLSAYLPIDISLLCKAIIAAICFGFASRLFTFLIHRIKDFSQKIFRIKWVIPVVGGLTIILLTLINGNTDYLGLGIAASHPSAITIPSAFTAGGADQFSWLWKTIYTSVTLGTGFKGGEVTPLFYIGATLGNTLSGLLNAPVSLFAACGFIAIFAGATKTPLASTIMGAELFGGHYILLFLLVCYIAYYCSGKGGIYSAQRAHFPMAL